MAEKILTTPISAKDLEDIRIGDILWLDGLITTCRDVAHRRLIDDDRPLPISLSGGAIFHAGPIVRPVSRPQNDPSPTYQIVSIGPTTSMRMEKFEKEFIRQTGVRLIVGKGGMGPLLLLPWKKLRLPTGRNLECRKPSGPAASVISDRSSSPLIPMETTFLKKTNFFLTKEKNWSARQFPVRSSSFIKRFILLCIGCQLGVVFF